MAHLVPMPPPTDYQVPTTTFKHDTSGRNDKICAWGADVPGASWRVGTDKEKEVESVDMSTRGFSNPYPGLRLFELIGVRSGMKLALFIGRSKTEFGQTSVSWQRYSPYVDVVPDVPPRPPSKHNKHILFYPPSDQPEKWIAKIENGLGQINSISIGQTVLREITDDVTIHYQDFGSEAQKSTSGERTIWLGLDGSGPCTGVDEVLLHELIHVVENWYSGYEDRYGFVFDKTDFLTVNATNVYSCVLGRALRKDHNTTYPLPVEHFKNPKLHWDQQKPNYKKAADSFPNLLRTLKQVKNVWNPFLYV
jgi:hypothetical protein